MDLNIKILKKSDGIGDCFKVRCEVFVEEQGFDISIELDEYDDVAYHVLITDGNNPIATSRFFIVDNKYKIGRVCVLKKYRGLNLGKKLLEVIESKVVELQGSELVLSAQLHSKGFYEKCGFSSIGDIYLEEGCEHIKMFKKVGI